MADVVGEQIEKQYDYECYLRFRSLNSVLSALAPWVAGWLLVGISVAAAGYAIRPRAEVVALDPVGRVYDLQIYDGNLTPKGK